MNVRAIRNEFVGGRRFSPSQHGRRGRWRRPKRLAVECLEDRRVLATFLVTQTSDDGAGTLRQAILNANLQSGQDEIHFDIPAQVVRSIRPSSGLPVITDKVIIDGTTQPGYAGTPIIQLGGWFAGSGVEGLRIATGQSTVRGLAINGFSGPGIVLENNGGNTVEGNFIGMDLAGEVDAGNDVGIFVRNGSSNNIIGSDLDGVDDHLEGNVIAGNAGPGIIVLGSDSIANQIHANSIFANGGIGIDLWGDGVTPHDPLDADAGPNRLLNAPHISLHHAGNPSVIEGTLSSTPDSTFFVEFYATEATGADIQEDLIQGQRYLGGHTVSTDSSGIVEFEISVPAATGQMDVITATATDQEGNTSEFSAYPLLVTVSTHGYNPVFPWESFREIWHELGDKLENLPAPNTDLYQRVDSYVSEWDSQIGWNQALISTAASFIVQPPFDDILRVVADLSMFIAGKLAEESARNIVADLEETILLPPGVDDARQRIYSSGIAAVPRSTPESPNC